MSAKISRLPSRFPIGTRYVVEGRDGQVQSRYLEFPDGRHVDLPADPVERRTARAGASSGRRRHRASVRKF